ncbi:MAG: DUF6034 family protein, partial [Clostridiales bacterium]|nr:DUF6034 family protein [Clostridiales bacterium]
TEMWQAATERTKAQILEEITELKELMNDARRLRDRFLLEPGEAEAYLVELEAKYAAAPERLEDIRAYGVLQEIPIYDFENKKVAAYTGFSAREKAEHGKALEVQNNNDVKEMVVVGKDKNGNITSMITPMRNAAFYFHNFAFYNWGTAALSQAEARGTIERLLEQIGGDMIIDRVVDLGYAYSVECARAAGGVPITSSGSWRGQYAIETTGLMETAPYWGYEKLVFEISQEGIADMCWLSPIEITDTAVENAKLLPFFEIQEIFAAMMAVKYAGQQGMFGVANPEAVVQTKAELWEELAELREIIHDADRLRDRRMMTPEEAQEYLIDLEARYAAAPEIAPLPSAELQYVLHFEIDRVTLTLQRIVDEGAYESGLLIPVWNFYDKSSGMSLLCINAIDGTIIEG